MYIDSVIEGVEIKKYDEGNKGKFMLEFSIHRKTPRFIYGDFARLLFHSKEFENVMQKCLGTKYNEINTTMRKMYGIFEAKKALESGMTEEMIFTDRTRKEYTSEEVIDEYNYLYGLGMEDYLITGYYREQANNIFAMLTSNPDKIIVMLNYVDDLKTYITAKVIPIIKELSGGDIKGIKIYKSCEMQNIMYIESIYKPESYTKSYTLKKIAKRMCINDHKKARKIIESLMKKDSNLKKHNLTGLSKKGYNKLMKYFYKTDDWIFEPDFEYERGDSDIDPEIVHWSDVEDE